MLLLILSSFNARADFGLSLQPVESISGLEAAITVEKLHTSTPRTPFNMDMSE